MRCPFNPPVTLFFRKRREYLPKAHSSLCSEKVVETLVVPEALRSTAPPVGAIGKIVEPAGDFWTVAFPLPFIGANRTHPVLP
jgi:hypothetical protein